MGNGAVQRQYSQQIVPIEEDWLSLDFGFNRRSWTHLNSFGGNGRSGHATEKCMGKAYSFGGFQEGRFTSKTINDVMVFEFNSQKWETVKCKGEKPSPRASLTLCSDENECIYLLGGINGPRGKICEDMFKFNVKTRTWTRLQIKDDTGGLAFGLYGQSLVRYNKKLYSFGGCRGMSYCQDMFMYDTASETMSILDCWGDKPSARYKHESFIVTNNSPSLFVVGGGDFLPRTFRLELFKLNLHSLQWRKMKSTGEAPPSRLAFSLSYDKTEDTCFIYGGLSITMERLFDLHCLDLRLISWRKINALNNPGKRAFHTSFMKDGELYIFGGADREQKLGDTWSLIVRTEVPKLAVLAAKVVGEISVQNQLPKNKSKYNMVATSTETLQFSMDKTFVPEEVLYLVHKKQS